MKQPADLTTEGDIQKESESVFGMPRDEFLDLQRTLLRQARSQSRYSEDAWDAVQNTYLSGLERKSQTQIRNPKAYFACIARRTIARTFKKLHQSELCVDPSTLECSVTATDISSWGRAVTLEDDTEEVATAIEALPKTLRTLLVLSLLGYDNTEIAQRLQRPENTVRTYLVRARKEVLQRLGNSGRLPTHPEGTQL